MVSQTRIVGVEPLSFGWKVTVTGHPTEALDRAHRLLDLLFSEQWTIACVNGQLPATDSRDDEFTIHVYGVRRR